MKTIKLFATLFVLIGVLVVGVPKANATNFLCAVSLDPTLCGPNGEDQGCNEWCTNEPDCGGCWLQHHNSCVNQGMTGWECHCHVTQACF